MIKNYTIILVGIALGIFFVQHAHADVWISDPEYVGFYDSDGIYWVVGAVKNSENHPVIPTLTISVQDGDKTATKSFTLASIMPGHEMPFKRAFLDIGGLRPVLDEAEISFIRGVHNNYAIKVMYDETLIVHPDGHITGRIINTGTQTVSDVRLLATIHGHDHGVLDMGENISPIVDMAPGEIRDFAMYPDPSVQSKVWYYSCFALGDLSVIALNTQRNDEVFQIRYDSRILISYPEFDESGEDLSFYVNPGWPGHTAVNLEFPRYSESEEFKVIFNDEQIKSVQSIDEMGNWHVVFSVEEQASGNLVISGFDPDATQNIETLIPDWVRNNAGWWSQGLISDEDFVSGIQYMIERDIIAVTPSEQQSSESIPDWVRNNAGWWSQGLISDEDFVSGLQYLVSSGILTV